MAKLYFYYGAMGSAKTATAIMTAYNYIEKGQNPLIAKPIIDNRTIGTIKSRTGMELECIDFDDIEKHLKAVNDKIDVIIVDEAQFLNKKEVDFLSDIVDYKGIPVLCYGLRTDYRGEFFEGSKRLMEVADVIKEVKTMCWCGSKATYNVRYDENGITRKGEQIDIGGNEKYTSLCRKHYKEGRLNK